MSGTAQAPRRDLASSNTTTEISQKACGPMLNLRIVRGSLQADQDEAILRKYNKLTSSTISIEEFRHWVQSGPEGPAYHALLETEDRQIAGHICLIPFRTKWSGETIVTAKAEYFFVEEKYRSLAVKGFENSFKPPAILLLDQLYRHCRDQGWGPLLISAAPAIQPLHLLVGCRSVDFPLVECLLILRPWRAATRTPNLTRPQRFAIFFVGCLQRSLWSLGMWLMRPGHTVNRVPLSSGGNLIDDDRVAFFEDEESMQWRYPGQGYVQFALHGAAEQFVIAKKGSGSGYLRVCQWNLSSHGSLTSFLLALVREARKEDALGVRWSVYSSGKRSTQIVGIMKKIGFLCAPRVRRLLFYTKNPELLRPGNWRITDSLFSFDP
jgi:hypothetical protein